MYPMKTACIAPVTGRDLIRGYLLKELDIKPVLENRNGCAEIGKLEVAQFQNQIQIYNQSLEWSGSSPRLHRDRAPPTQLYVMPTRKDNMTNHEKAVLRRLVRVGLSFDEIKKQVSCSDATIKRYIKALRT